MTNENDKDPKKPKGYDYETSGGDEIEAPIGGTKFKLPTIGAQFGLGVMEEATKFAAKTAKLIPVIGPAVSGLLSIFGHGVDRMKDARIDAQFSAISDSIGDL